MARHTKNIPIPKGQIISKKFLERLDKIYKEEKPLIDAKQENERRKLKVEIEINFDEGSIKYDSFEEVLSLILPEKIRSLEVEFRTFVLSAEYLSFDLRIDNKNPGLSRCNVSGSNEEIVNRIKNKTERVFKDFRTDYYWLYSLKNAPVYLISLILSVSATILIFQIFRSINNPILNLLFTVIVAPAFLFFLFLFNGLISWIFPEVDFNLIERISNKREIVKYILGAIAIGLIVNLIWWVIESI